jgi:hypothetical protein
MSAWKRNRVHRREGDLSGGRSTSPRVERLLDSGRAPGTSRELAREDEATLHFHRAHLERVHTTREATTMSKPSPRTGLKAAIASAGAVALMTTGAAFAASSHAPWSGAASSRPTAIPSHSHPTDGSSATDEPSESGDASAAESGSTAEPNAHAYPGLCRAYAAGQKTEHGDSLSSPAFAGLVAAAGGPEAVTNFCASLTPAPSHPTHPALPTHPVAPTHATPTHSVPTHPALPTHPAGSSHPGSATHPGPGSHPSRP